MASIITNLEGFTNMLIQGNFNKARLFGPWIGEFAHEFLYWKDWVCAEIETSTDAVNIVASFPGHHIFYPNAAFYIPHSEKSGILQLSAHGPVVDGFICGYPGNLNGTSHGKNILSYLRTLVNTLRSTGIEHVEVSAPFLYSASSFHSHLIGSDLGYQTSTPASHTWIKPHIHKRYHLAPDDSELVNTYFNLLDQTRKTVAILPRLRSIRRPDKNLSSYFYQQICCKLISSGHNCIIIGTPNGAHLLEGIFNPKYYLDLVTEIDPMLQLSLHTRAFSFCDFAIGGLSGGMVYALYCKLPSIVIGNRYQAHQLSTENVFRTKFVYLTNDSISDDILVTKVLEKASCLV